MIQEQKLYFKYPMSPPIFFGLHITPSGDKFEYRWNGKTWATDPRPGELFYRTMVEPDAEIVPISAKDAPAPLPDQN